MNSIRHIGIHIAACSLIASATSGQVETTGATSTSGDRLAELRQMFRRPAGTRITDRQKQALSTFVRQHTIRATDRLGWACALDLYLRRQAEPAAAALDQYFGRHASIPIEEHATMAGRVYLGAVARGLRAEPKNSALLKRRIEAVTRLYPDLQLVERVITRSLNPLPTELRRDLRLAAARGALASGQPAGVQMHFLQALVAQPAATEKRKAIPATPIRRMQPANPTGAAERRAAAEAKTKRRAALTGKPAPALAVQHTVQGPKDLQLANLEGKVVVLDFTATWCGPCRRVIPHLIALQKRHEGQLQVVAVSRFYGYGADYRNDGTGKITRGIDQETEVEINAAFAQQFGIQYPVVLVDRSTMSTEYGVAGIPTLFVIGKNGRVAGHVVGAGSEAQAKVDAMIETALTGEPKQRGTDR